MLKHMHSGRREGEEEFFTYNDAPVEDSARLWLGHGLVFSDTP